MCLILFSYNCHPVHRLVLLANRDEFYDRPTANAHYWEEDPTILGGKDLKHGGTWLGITKSGKIAAITNFRDPSNRKEDAPSRGFLVSDFLKNSYTPSEYFNRIKSKIYLYNDFNLLLGDRQSLCCISSHTMSFDVLPAGVYGLSNHLLNTTWPKVRYGLDELVSELKDGSEANLNTLFNILADKTIPEDEFLPDTGVGLEWERILSPIFITSPTYGTRSSTLLLIDYENKATLMERNYDPIDSAIFTDQEFKLTLDD